MYVLGYPKSGNTWFCYLLSYCLNTEYDTLENPGIHPKDEYQRRYVKGGLEHHSYRRQIGKVLKTHSLQIKNEDNTPIVYLVRDGRDVMVSYYFYQNAFNQKVTPQKLGKTVIIAQQLHRLGIEKLASFLEHYTFSKFIRQHTLSWINHVKVGIEKKPIAIIRYEDLKTNPEKTLEDLFIKLEVRVLPEVIQQAVATFSFERLSKRKAGEEDKTSFFRKGVVGDWRNYFLAKDNIFFQEKARYVLEMLGYSI